MSILNVVEAQAAILAAVPILPTKQVELRALAGCVLAEPVCMERDQPPFERVTMDGIAFDATHTATDARLHIAGTQAAGAAPMSLPTYADCIEVMTGAQLPTGCDCVIPVERIAVSDGFAQLDGSIKPAPWLNVHRRGSDAVAGQSILSAGTHLGALEVAVIASAGYAHVQARTAPCIALVSTGDELIEPGQPIHDWQVRRSNTYALQAALQRAGLPRLVDAHLADHLDLLRTRLAQLLDSNDVLILSGGVSMGQFDFVPQALTELGIRCVFHKIAQRPGKPMWFGARDDGKAVYALPGNPVSTLICLYRYVLPGIWQSMGRTPVSHEYITLHSAAKAHEQLTSFLPVKLTGDTSGDARALPSPTRGSGDFISLLGTDGFVELPPAQGMIQAGTMVPLFRW